MTRTPLGWKGPCYLIGKKFYETYDEFWNETEQDKIRALYRGAVEAGSDLFLTNSFGANASRLKLHDAGHHLLAVFVPRAKEHLHQHILSRRHHDGLVLERAALGAGEAAA